MRLACHALSVLQRKRGINRAIAAFQGAVPMFDGSSAAIWGGTSGSYRPKFVKKGVFVAHPGTSLAIKTLPYFTTTAA